MRILVDIRHLARPEQSGVGEYTAQLLRALFDLDKNNAYTLLSSGSSRSKVYAQMAVREMTEGSPKIRHVHIPIANKLLNLQALSRFAPTLPEFAGKGAFHVLFLPNLNITRVPDDLPIVLTIHDLAWKIFPHFFSRKMLAWHNAVRPDELIDRANKIITPSQCTKRDVELIFKKPSSDIIPIPHGIDDDFSPRPKPQDSGLRSLYRLPQRFLLFLGTLEPRKNLPTLIRGVEEYRARTGDDIPLVLVGKWGWRTKEIERAIKKPWIHHLGYVENRHRSALYRLADALVWPSFYEGFGLPLLEAMASGTPIITSSTSSMPEITNESAIHVDPYNHLDIADALEQFFAVDALSQKLSQAGLAEAKKFTWTACAQATLNVFKQAAEQKS